MCASIAASVWTLERVGRGLRGRGGGESERDAGRDAREDVD